MDLWRNQAANEMMNLLKNFTKIININLIGSMLNQNLLDMYSDVDMKIHLSDNAAIDIKKFFMTIEKQLCNIRLSNHQRRR